MWPWAQLQLLLFPLLVILLLQLPLNLLRHLHLQQVLQASLWLIPNKYLPAGEAREELVGIPWTSPPPNPAPTWMSFSQVTCTSGSGSQLCSSRRIK